MNKKEIEATIKVPANIRYEYFIKKIVDNEEIWALICSNGFAMANDEAGNLVFPFWPRKEFAKFCAIDDWASCEPERIDLYDFINKWLPGMKEDGLRASIFSNNNDAALVSVEVLLSDIKEELDNY